MMSRQYTAVGVMSSREWSVLTHWCPVAESSLQVDPWPTMTEISVGSDVRRCIKVERGSSWLDGVRVACHQAASEH